MARRKHHYYVYVVALDDKVWNEARFRRANPDYRFDKPCVYVGMTGLDPDLRFDRHKAGIQANRYVRDYGLRLVPELYEVFNPMPYRGAPNAPYLVPITVRAVAEAKGVGEDDVAAAVTANAARVFGW